MSIQQLIEKYEGGNLEDILKHLYIDEDMSIPQVAQRLTVSVGLVHKWLHKFSITKQKNLWKDDRYFTSNKVERKIK